MAPEQLRLTPAERANLVAYIDGELSEAESRAIATKLTKSATARREIEALEQTWEMLELLPRPKVSEELTARTLTEIQKLELEGKRLESAVRQTATTALRLALAIGVSLLACAAGYATTQWVWPNPTARLARDLSIAEHLDEYRDAGNIDFLRELVNASEFDDDHN